MTNEEALKYWLKQKPQGRQNGKDFWLTVAKALEKQIPKKPNFEGDGYPELAIDYDIWRCPNCGQKIDFRGGIL